MPVPIAVRRLARSLLQMSLAAPSSAAAWWMVTGSLSGGLAASALANWLAVAIPVRALIYLPFGLYGELWRYTGPRELAAIAAAVSAGSALLAVLVAAGAHVPALTAAFFVADSLVLAVLLVAVRVPSRWRREHEPRARARRVLVYGAGDAAAMILRDMRSRADSPYEPVGIIDDDAAKHGLRLHGVKVLGGRSCLGDAVRQLVPAEVLIAMPSADRSTLRAIVGALQPSDVAIKTLPALHELPECRVEMAQIRPLAMEDLLTRPIVGLDHTAVDALVRGRRVLVTGAGGSIGSELCRQLLRWSPEALIPVERHENALFWLTHELSSALPGATRLVPSLLDVTSEEGLERLFAATRPHIVFHAAAHKHVPLLEAQVREAVHNNVTGTLRVARAAERHAVERFVLISTDKAVAPVSVMGATKRLGELAVQTLMRNSRTRFCAVRFGNVLGSNGSVTLVFFRQIRAGGPVTVTHPDMRRYFMLISEAVQLVAHAATLAGRGTVYGLEMGEPIRILDLAQQMIRLAGCRPGVDVPIEFTGLRPGERLTESLVDETEHVQPSATQGLFQVVPEILPDAARLARHLTRLEQAVASGAPLTLDDLLEEIPRALPAARRQAVG
jgi:FlaA1/EpsC-like NDP-sugar epimerase